MKTPNIYFLVLNNKAISVASSFAEIELKRSGLIQVGFKPQVFDAFGNEVCFLKI